MTDKTDSAEKLFEILMQIGKLVGQHINQSHEEKRATMLQFSTLSFLNNKPGQTLGNIADFLKLSKSSATQLVERLVGAGLVNKVMDKKDLRITRVVLTKSGEDEIKKQKKKMIQMINKLFSNTPEKDIKELIRIYSNIITHIQQKHE